MNPRLPAAIASTVVLAVAALAQSPGAGLSSPPNGMAAPDAAIMSQPKRVFPPTKKPPAEGNFIGLSTANGRVAWDFTDLWFNQKEPQQAFDRYVARTGYVNHTSTKGSEPHSFEQARDAEARITPPAARFIFKQVVAQGDLVVLHIEATAAPGKPKDEMVMILRLRGGKITDHWDLHIPLAPDSNVFDRMGRQAT